MKHGTFIYVIDGRRRDVAVRECPNPAAARAMLEQLLQVPVAWREAPMRP